MVRLRDLNLSIGLGRPGMHNAITDVPGVRVGHRTLIQGRGALQVGQGPVRTGVTVVCPRGGLTRDNPVFAGCHRLNGNGEMTGLEWIREAGVLTTPIAITNTHSVGMVRDALIRAELRDRTDQGLYWCMPVVGETFDGLLNDINGMHVTPEDVFAALDQAQGGRVAEGSVGGGTGMICHEFKGGIGTASRVVAAEDGGWVVGALVQANHGRRANLRLDGEPIGQVLGYDRVPSPWNEVAIAAGGGSIIAIVATNAPLLPHQCNRLAQRATIGVARAGGGGEDSSGDLFFCFATGNSGIPRADYARRSQPTVPIEMVTNDYMTALFDAAIESVEEAIWNAMLSAETMTGRDGIVAHGLTPELVQSALQEVSLRRFSRSDRDPASLDSTSLSRTSAPLHSASSGTVLSGDALD
jgi:D-aminopeptidase